MEKNSPSEKLKRFFATSKPSHYKKDEIVLRIGDARSGAFFIKRGFIKDSTISPDGREFTLFIFKPEDIFSFSWIFNKIPNEHSFRAMSECIIYEKSREGLLLFLEQNPDVLLMISQNIAIRLRGVLQRLESLAFGNAAQKVGSILYLLAERFGKDSPKGVTIPIPLTQKDIAELIGQSRETTSIEIKKLIDLGVIQKNAGFYTVLNLKKLQKIFNLLS